MKFKAFKMDGLGNDFLIIDNRNQKISLSPEQILKLSNREKGIGFDQLIYIENSTQADAEIKYFNSDGQMADACGNGNRCISDILIKEKNKNNVTFEVNNFVHTGSKNIDNLINVIMPKPKIKLSEIPVTNDVQNNPFLIEINSKKLEGHLINVGNPHIIFFEKISDEELKKIGPLIENLKYFPDRINVTFANIQNEDNIDINVWERGAGKTLACGTAACATAYIASDLKLTKNPVNIHFQRGHLLIKINSDKTMMMTGPVSEKKEIEVSL
ncbi:MAG: diaminopimelate epimerase [Pelagibacteraceae bacterium]|nr:diaminopimelate epimerase [Pelagibacteraceae bacterium]MCI5079832.1 diaminopimelate epimerase [Pelagibacteraceae bacterium]